MVQLDSRRVMEGNKFLVTLYHYPRWSHIERKVILMLDPRKVDGHGVNLEGVSKDVKKV